VYRLAYTHRPGPARTLRDMLAQEGAVMAAAGCSGPALDPDDVEYTRWVLEPFLGAADMRTCVECLFGDAAGFLTGKYRTEADLSKSARGAKVGKSYLNERGLRVLAAADAVAADLGASPAQVALAWLMARPSITAPIASATTPAQFDDLVAAARLTLGPDAIARLSAASA
jgi:hypothetical protein